MRNATFRSDTPGSSQIDKARVSPNGSWEVWGCPPIAYATRGCFLKVPCYLDEGRRGLEREATH
jgi:hypothetical protein